MACEITVGNLVKLNLQLKTVAVVSAWNDPCMDL